MNTLTETASATPSVAPLPETPHAKNSVLFTNLQNISLEELQEEYRRIVALKRRQEQEKHDAEKEKFAAKVRELPLFLGVQSLEEVATAVRSVLGPKSVGHRVNGVRDIEAFKPSGMHDRYERACVAIRAGASQKQIENAFGYSISWYYKTKRDLGLSMKYKRKAARKTASVVG